MIAPTNSAGKASSAKIVAQKMPQIESAACRIRVIPRVRACSTVTT